jgi:hypothetical protein
LVRGRSCDVNTGEVKIMSAEVPEGFAAAVGIDWADRKRERGRAHHAAIRALAFKWLRTLYRCW